MHLVSFSADNRTSWGVLNGAYIHDVGACITAEGRTLGEVLRAKQLEQCLAEIPQAPSHLLSSVELLSPITDAQKIICVGLNYADHVREMNKEVPQYPVIFTRWNDTLVGHEQPLIAPKISERFDYEGELAVILSRSAYQVTPEEATTCILGYSIVNDGSVRDFQRHTHQFTPGKNFPKSGSFGPYIVTVDEIPSIGGLRIKTQVNGATVQSSTLDELIFSIPELISYCSQWTELAPGDVIVTGTPGGVGDSFTPPLWIRPGDIVEVEVDRIGTLRNRVQAEANS